MLVVRNAGGAVTGAEMKEIVKLKLKPGTPVEVKTDGEWWEANVLDLQGDIVLIEYVGGR